MVLPVVLLCSAGPATAQECRPVGLLGCGILDGTVEGRNDAAGSTDVLDGYGACPGSCGTWDESGPEYAYSFVAPEAGDYTVVVAGPDPGVDLDVFVVEHTGGVCDAAACVACGGDSANWAATAGTRYDIVVDGYAGAAGAYEIAVACPPRPTCEPLADPVVPGRSTFAPVRISCGDTVTDSTLVSDRATDNVDLYSCSGRTNGDRELAYSFTAHAGIDVVVDLTILTPGRDLDVFVLADAGVPCDPEACTAYGDTTAAFTTTAGATYYVVVDGPAGNAAEFQLDLACDCDADRDGHDASGADCGGDDCEDTDGTSAPGLPELCDGHDNDCDGSRDEDGVCSAADADADAGADADTDVESDEGEADGGPMDVEPEAEEATVGDNGGTPDTEPDDAEPAEDASGPDAVPVAWRHAGREWQPFGC